LATTAIFVRLSDVVGTDRHKAAIANLHLTMEFKKPFSLSAVLGAESAAAEDEHHGMLEPKTPSPSEQAVSGKKLPQKEFRMPLMKTLFELGGSAHVSEIRKVMERKMASLLNEADY